MYPGDSSWKIVFKQKDWIFIWLSRDVTEIWTSFSDFVTYGWGNDAEAPKPYNTQFHHLMEILLVIQQAFIFLEYVYTGFDSLIV